MKLYKVEIAGIEHTIQLSEDEAREKGLTAVGEVRTEGVDLRAPSAKGEAEDDMGRPLVESVHAENAARKARKAVANKARATADEK